MCEVCESVPCDDGRGGCVKCVRVCSSRYTIQKQDDSYSLQNRKAYTHIIRVSLTSLFS